MYVLALHNSRILNKKSLSIHLAFYEGQKMGITRHNGRNSAGHDGRDSASRSGDSACRLYRREPR